MQEIIFIFLIRPLDGAKPTINPKARPNKEMLTDLCQRFKFFQITRNTFTILSQMKRAQTGKKTGENRISISLLILDLELKMCISSILHHIVNVKLIILRFPLKYRTFFHTLGRFRTALNFKCVKRPKSRRN